MFLSVVTLLSCAARTPLTVTVPSDMEAVMGDFVGFVGDERLSVETGERAGGRGLHILVVLDQECTECFELTREDRVVTVHAGDVLGAQYGSAAAMEALGYRFYNPYRSHIPETLAWPEALPEGVQSPEMTRRGIHMHTLHPIEGLYDFWVPSEPLEDAERVMDWVVKNRGNHIQWVGLKDIEENDGILEAWQERTAELIDSAHSRGLTTGLGIQLFAGANLQLAFDLVDDEDGDQRAQMETSFTMVTEKTAFDLYNLSFGEFSDYPPEDFLESVNLAYAVMQEQAPQAEMTTVLHVGEDLQVEYQGETMVYYLLAQYADPGITPWVHTVMFYNLYQDAGGAYHHETFDQHRAVLESRLAQRDPVGYFPESAYWVAFDTSVPAYYPLYMRSRHLDMAQALANAGAPIDDHVLFSSGWEWGYWQNDVATLRMNWALPQDYSETIFWIFEPFPGLGQVVVDTAELQNEALIEGRLTPWVVGVDNVMEIGYGTLDIISQPKRPLYKDFENLDPDDLAGIEADIDGLRSYADSLAALQTRAEDLDLPESVFVDEVRQGLQIDVLRAQHAADVAQAVLELDPTLLDAAEARLPTAQAVVDARHGDLMDPNPERLLTEGGNPTLYQFGYLHRAAELCYWERELAQARNVVQDAGLPIPGCSL